MLIDSQLYLATAQAVTVTAVTTNIFDSFAIRDLGNGDGPTLDILAWVTTVYAGGTSMQFQFQGSADNSTWYTIIEGPAVALAALTVGARLMDTTVPRMLQGGTTPLQATPRYYRGNWVVVGTMTSGNSSALIVIDRQTAMYYPPGLVITN